MFRRMNQSAMTLVVFCTCPDAAVAQGIASALVETGSAACVNMLPGLTSVYRWQGKTEYSEEVLLIIKTTSAAYPSLEGRIRELHPYEVPEILAIETSNGLPAYLEWVESCTRS